MKEFILFAVISGIILTYLRRKKFKELEKTVEILEERFLHGMANKTSLATRINLLENLKSQIEKLGEKK